MEIGGDAFLNKNLHIFMTVFVDVWVFENTLNVSNF